jgi:protein-disulfide isomerase
VRAWGATLGRLLLAAVFGYAALTTISDPEATARSVRAYRVLPDSLAVAVGRGLPAAELVLALLLVVGVALRVTAGIAAGLLVVFLAGIVSADARGLQIDCGCLGGGGPTDHPSYGLEITRDAVLLLVAVGTVLAGRSRWALAPSVPEAPPPVDAAASGAERRRQRTALHRHESAVARSARLSRWAAVGAAVGVLGAALLGIGIAAATAPAPPTAVPAGVTPAGGIVVGDASAPRTVIAYEDPQCPICRQFEESTGSVLAQAVRDGRVKVEYRMRSFLGPESVRAVAALGAAQDEGRFEELREQLFAHQPAERTGGFTVDDLVRLGADAGLTDSRYVQAVRTQRYAAWARQVDDRASRDGNTGTPSLLLDGTVLDNQVLFDAAAFRKALGG